ncbi:MAG TPA: hypothetical protein H9908_04445 [Candidatus Rothia avistercoris]|uniref:RiboL-PSP-HEPN domain-containing protein n=1 Tax=Candidatus Rothia avistercoris TaxID=2840479 RepID=A0A9D2ZSY2_9MICC|nr:hypothetical protein [Candidatus Rothia avistercoris]
MEKQHPFQNALDTATAASYTLTDLFEINYQRREWQKGDKEKLGRPDSRQVSLYKSIITSSIAALEEFIEGLIFTSFLEINRLQDNNFTSTEMLEDFLRGRLSRDMQNPSSSNIGNLSKKYLGINITEFWEGELFSSQINYKVVGRKKGEDKVELASQSYLKKRCDNKDINLILNKFILVRNSFAHQDSSISVFKPDEIKRFRKILEEKSIDEESKEKIGVIACALSFFLKESPGRHDDPLLSWTVHERHCINSLYLYFNIVTSLTSGIIGYLEENFKANYSSFQPLVFSIEDGAWSKYLPKIPIYKDSNISVNLIDYAPNSRLRGVGGS